MRSNSLELFRDRRGAPRLTVRFPAVLRDATHAWRAEVRNLSSSGCLLQVGSKLPVGKQFEIELKPEARPALRLRASIVHVEPGGLIGLAFELAESAAFEQSLDLFEWLLAQNPGLAVEVQKRPVMLARDTMLWALSNDQILLRPEETRFLALFAGGRTLGDAEKILGPRFAGLMYLAFSLLDRRMLTTVKPGTFQQK